MTKLFDYEPIEENTLVDRVLLRVHKAVDEAFPKATPAVSRRFAKTVFADEPTINQPLPTDVRAFLNNDSEASSGVSRFSQDNDSNATSRFQDVQEETSPRSLKQNIRRFLLLLGIFVLTTLILYWSRL